MKPIEALEKIKECLGGTGGSYKEFFGYSPKEGLELTGKELERIEGIAANSDQTFWSQAGQRIVVSAIHAAYCHMVEKGEDADIMPFAIPEMNSAHTRFSKDAYFVAWTSAVSTGNPEIGSALERAINRFNKHSTMGFEYAIAKRNKRKEPYTHEEISAAIDEFIEAEHELRMLIYK